MNIENFINSEKNKAKKELIHKHEELRSHFPHLSKNANGSARLYLDNSGGSLMAKEAIDQIVKFGIKMNPQAGNFTSGEKYTKEIQNETKSLIAKFINANSEKEIIFNSSTTHSLYNVSLALSEIIKREDNIIVTDLDHFANITPWENLGKKKELEVRRVGITKEGKFDLNHFEKLIDRKTKIIAVTYSSNAIGTIVPVNEISKIIDSYATYNNRALFIVDAVQHAPHGPIDVRKINCDFLTISGYKLFGPMLGVLWVRNELLEKLRPFCVIPSKNLPIKYEQGTCNNISIIGLKGALEYIGSIGKRFNSYYKNMFNEYSEPTTRLFKIAMHLIKQYEQDLSRYIIKRFLGLPENIIKLYGIFKENESFERDPTFSFEIKNINPTEVKKMMWELCNIEIADGTNYSAVISRHLKKEQMNRVSFSHYNNIDDIDLFFHCLSKLNSNQNIRRIIK